MYETEQTAILPENTAVPEVVQEPEVLTEQEEEERTDEEMVAAYADRLKNADPDYRFSSEYYETLIRVVPKKTIAQVYDLLRFDKAHKPVINLANAEAILTFDPNLRDLFMLNEMSHRIDVMGKVGWTRDTDGPFDDHDLYNVHLYCERAYGFTSLPLLSEAVSLVAGRNAYHPIRDMLCYLEWDGKERVAHALHHFLGAEDDEYNAEVMKVFMLGAVERVFSPGVKFDHILCLTGDQGAGKSTFLRFLAICDDWYTDDLKDLETGKVFEKLQGHWIVELSEMLAARNAKSTEAVKSFISRQSDVYRMPYERYPKDRPRQCVLAGTTNRNDFLPADRSGNRRFLPVKCCPEKAEVFILDDEQASREYILQMWAEIMELRRRGKTSLIMPRRLWKEVEEKLKEFSKEDSDAGMIQAFMERYQGDRVCTRMLFKEALRNEFLRPTRQELWEIGDIMERLIKEKKIRGWQAFSTPKRFSPEYGTQRGWERIKPEPPKDEPIIDEQPKSEPSGEAPREDGPGLFTDLQDDTPPPVFRN